MLLQLGEIAVTCPRKLKHLADCWASVHAAWRNTSDLGLSSKVESIYGPVKRLVEPGEAASQPARIVSPHAAAPPPPLVNLIYS